MDDLLQAPKRNDLIYDVGLHRGEDTEFYLRKGFRVVAFEANPALVDSCRSRFAHFIERGQLVIIEGAIVDSGTLAAGCGRVRFYENEAGTGWGTVHQTWAERNQRQGAPSNVMEVQTIDFARVVADHGVPHYLKIDIEGADLVCVSALKAFKERPDYISIESDKTSFANIGAEIDLFCELGYDSFQAVEQSRIPECQRPPSPAREGSYVPHRFELGASGLFGAELEPSWKSRAEVLRLYRLIRLGYYLLGDEGRMYKWQFRGASTLRRLANGLLGRLTGAPVPGWYDTHARLSKTMRPAGF
jgi:FkbM family methyltransferase